MKKSSRDNLKDATSKTYVKHWITNDIDTNLTYAAKRS